LRRSSVLWLIAIVVTLGSAVWQRATGPTYPRRVRAEVGGLAVSGKLPRSGIVHEPVAISLEAAPQLGGEIRWRRFPTDDPWQTAPLRRAGDRLVGELPAQTAPAAKVEYAVWIFDTAGDSALFPVTARFKGAVPLPVVVVHVAAMFLGMLFSLRAGLEALAHGPGLRRQVAATLVCLGAGGLLLGPVVQKYAFDAYWTGWPVGEDLTDNKLALAVLFWAVAAWRLRRDHTAWTVVASAVTFVVFMIPHSLHGSTHDWETGGQIQTRLELRQDPLASPPLAASIAGEVTGRAGT